MKKLLTILLFIPCFIYGQSWKQSVFVAPECGIYFSHYDEKTLNEWKPGFSAGYNIDYYFPKAPYFSLGASLEYLYANGYSSFRDNSSLFVFDSYSRQHALELPINLKIGFHETKHLFTYLHAGIGASYLFLTSTKRENRISGDVMYYNRFGDRIGVFASVGIGQQFRIENRLFYVQAVYRQDLISALMAEPSIRTADRVAYDYVNRRNFGLRLGFFLHKITE